jgi:hypothetical protein
MFPREAPLTGWKRFLGLRPLRWNCSTLSVRSTPSAVAFEALGRLGRAVISSTAVHSIAEGKNYCIDEEDGVTHCRVWRRPDLDVAEGAALAAELADWFEKLAVSQSTRTMLFDLSKAPEVVGPETQQALAEMLEAWEQARKPVAVVCGATSMQRLQLRRLAATAAPRLGGVFYSSEEASAWLRGAPRASKPDPAR